MNFRRGRLLGAIWFCALLIVATVVAEESSADVVEECIGADCEATQPPEEDCGDSQMLKEAKVDLAKYKFGKDYEKNIDLNVRMYQNIEELDSQFNRDGELLNKLFHNYYSTIAAQKKILELIPDSQLQDFTFLLEEAFYKASIVLVEQFISLARAFNHLRQKQSLHKLALPTLEWYAVRRWSYDFVFKIKSLVQPSDLESLRAAFESEIDKRSTSCARKVQTEDNGTDLND